MKKYETYKDSGLEWLGMVPEHWKTMKVKYICNVTDGTHFSPATISEGKPYITVSNVKDDFIDIESAGRISIADFNELVKQGCQPETGDVLLAKDGTVGRTAIVKDNDYVVLSSLGILSPNDNLTSSYLKYMLDSSILQEQMNEAMAGSALRRITITKIKDFIALLPPTSEQRAIASYLDHKVGQIDALISEKEKMVEDLKAYRSSLITETVTKGLNKEVKMKDSGVEWIGRIPTTWQSSKIGWIYSDLGSGTTPDSNNNLYYKDEGYNWLQTGDLTDGYITETSKHISQLAIDEKRMRFYPVDSIVVAMYGATIGKVGYLKIETSTNQACCVLPPSENMDAMYLFYTMHASKEFLISNSIGGGQPNISQSIIREHIIPVPPLKIQKEIASFLQNKIGKIVSTLSELEHQLSDLKSYKSSLITEAVTGKIDLRDWQTKKS